MRLKYTQNMKPREIAKKLKMSVEEISKVDQRLKKNLAKSKQVSNNAEAGTVNVIHKQQMTQFNDPALKDLVSQHLQLSGIYNLKKTDIQKFIQEAKPGSAPLQLNVISHILKNDFGLRYKHFDGALIKYKDPQFDEKRLWVSRILAQFIGDDALIISIDESNFRNDNIRQWRWQFVERDYDLKKIIENSAQPDQVNEQPESSFAMYGDIQSELSFISRSRKLHAGSMISRGRGRRQRAESEESKGAGNAVAPVFTTIPASRGRGRPRLDASQSSHSSAL